MSALSDLLNGSIPAGTSSRELSRLCNGALSRQTFDNYRKGHHPERPDDDVLIVFHELLKIPIQKLREAGNRPPGEASPWEPPSSANLMNQRQRDAVTELIRSFIETIGAANAIPTDQTSPTRASSKAGQAQEKVSVVGAAVNDTQNGTIANIVGTEPGDENTGMDGTEDGESGEHLSG